MSRNCLEKGRGYAYRLSYHIVWCVKDRQPVFDNEEWKKALADVLTSIAHEKEFLIEMIDIKDDYVHLLISCKPQHYIPDIIKTLKGGSGRKMQCLLPDLQKRMADQYHIWDTSYMIVSGAADASEDVEAYISNYKMYRTYRK